MGCVVSPFINSHGFGSCSISDAFLVFARAFCFFLWCCVLLLPLAWLRFGV